MRHDVEQEPEGTKTLRKVLTPLAKALSADVEAVVEYGVSIPTLG